MITYTPFDSNSCPSGLAGNRLEGAFGPVNVSETERYGSIIAGAALAAAGLSRRSLPGLLVAAVGGLFIMRGFGGHCRLYDSIGVSTAKGRTSGVPDRTGHKVEKTILIARPPAEVFRFWRNLENFPEFMENIESVRVLDDRRSHWVVKGPGGQSVEWDAEIVNEHPGEMISWQTLPGADVQSAGTVRFTPADEGRSTTLRVVLEFHPPAGAFGAGVARFFGRDPSAQLDQDLARLKRVIENSHPAGVAG
jgi:uncharacterized membrane protein